MIKQKFRRGMSALLAMILLGQSAPAALAAVEDTTAEGSIAITDQIFPDAAFRKWLGNPAHINGYGADGVLTAEELSDIRSIDVANQNLTTLQGIEVFSALESLNCKNNMLTSLDVSQNTGLKYLHCAFNRISSLDVSGLKELISLNCESNGMTALNLTGCSALEIIYCRNNNLPVVDFSTNTKLKFIETFDNKLTDVDLSMLSELEFVHLDHNRLTHLDLSRNTNLSPIGSGFVARNNWLETLTLPVSSSLVVEASVYDEQDPKVGHERTEWYLDTNFTQPVPDELPANGQTLYVKWLPNDYTIYFSSNGGSGSMPSQAAVWDTELVLPNNEFSRWGYQFTGWKNTFGNGKIYSAQETVKNLGGEIQGDRVTLYAQWKPIQYHIAFAENGGSGQMDPITAEYDQVQNLPDCTFTPPDGMEFAGWSLTQGGAVRYKNQASVRNLTAQEGDTVTLYAVWREPVVNQYLQKLDQAFFAYVPTDYTAQDWAELVAQYEAARTQMASADEQQLVTLLSQAKREMAQVLTLTKRIEQVTLLWRSTYGEVIGQIDGQAITEANAVSIGTAAEQALEGLTPEFVAAQTNLKDEEDCQLVAASAVQQVEEIMQGLRRLTEAAQWAAALNGLSTRTMSEVTATWLPVYENAIAEAKMHTAQLQTALLDALQQRAELSQQKQQAVAQLHMDHSSYDPSHYTEEGIQQLDSILHTAVAAIEQASSVSDVKALLSRAQEDLRAVPDINHQTPPDSGAGGDDGDDNNGGGGSTGGGGSAGGGNDGSPTPPEEVPDSILNLSVSGTVDSTGKVYNAQISADNLSKSVQTVLQAAQTAGTAPAIHIAVTSDAAETVQLALSTNALAQLGAHKQATFGMETPIGAITLDAAALVSIANWAENRTITMTLTKAAQSRRDSDTSQSLWAWRISCDEKELTALHGGQAEVSIPYTLSVQQNAACVIIHTQNAAGGWSEVQTSYDIQRQMAHFVTAAPCVFTVGYDATMAWSGSFADVDKQAWYYPAVRYVCYYGMMNGTSAESFAPESEFSRAQMAQILYNMEGRPQTIQAMYTDVSQDAWYATAISWAMQSGILTGYGDGRVGPDDPITREQLAAILYRYAGQKGYDTSAQADLSGFADADAVSAYARLPLSWAHAAGVVNGTDAITLDPNGTATRAQAATMLMRFHKTI